MLVDSHAHLETFDDLESVLARAKEAQVGKIVTIGTSLDSSKKAIEIAQKYSEHELEIYSTVGLHPKDAKNDIKNASIKSVIVNLKKIAKSSKKVVAIGEAGLDYYLINDNKQLTTNKEKKIQRELFVGQTKLADELNLPLVVHCRNGWSEIFDLLSTVNRELRTVPGVFHSWTGDWNAAKRALDLGFYISFSGIVTFKQSLRSSQTAGLKNAGMVADVAKKAPLDRILIETDSPFLAPEPNRGQKNEPKNVRIIADFLAEIRSRAVDEISKQTSVNAQKLFDLL